eukprot:CAMPEP_0184697126 /NCGR_PEP_ID=MMETSP0313-20130426/4197_1 /TAXON_ID=2792 /ORGANISM="Porphyridium aerugineum, Strain SAG 1380-2" /LENGTH=769 /DNA_ID=CAMNT_0027155889 /DNA_START=149 /DNA_END=2458 /DNA_ORIENTATION=-
MSSTQVTSVSPESHSDIGLREGTPARDKELVQAISTMDNVDSTAPCHVVQNQDGLDYELGSAKNEHYNSSLVGNAMSLSTMTRGNDQEVVPQQRNVVGDASLHSQSSPQFKTNRQRFELPTLIPSSQRRDRPLWEGPIDLKPDRLHCSSHVGMTKYKNPIEAEEVWPTILQRSRASAVQLPANTSAKSVPSREDSIRWECSKRCHDDTSQPPTTRAKRRRLKPKRSELPDSSCSSLNEEGRRDDVLCIALPTANNIIDSNCVAEKQSHYDMRLQTLRNRIRSAKNTVPTTHPSVTRKVRNRAVRRLTETLSESAKVLATEIESECNLRHGENRMMYSDYMRKLLSNIRMNRNPELNKALVQGIVSPKQLVQMSPADMSRYKVGEHSCDAEPEGNHTSNPPSATGTKGVFLKHGNVEDAFEVTRNGTAKGQVDEECGNEFRKEREFKVDKPSVMESKTSAESNSNSNTVVEKGSGMNPSDSLPGRPLDNIWFGSVFYPQSSGFEAIGGYLSGSRSASIFVPSKVEIRGTTELIETLDYFHQLQFSPLLVMLTFAIMPKSPDDEAAYWQLCKLLNYGHCAGVAIRQNNIRVYVVPPGRAAKTLHEAGGTWLLGIAVVQAHLLCRDKDSFVSNLYHEECHPTGMFDNCPFPKVPSPMASYSGYIPEMANSAANPHAVEASPVDTCMDVKSQSFPPAPSMPENVSMSCNAQQNMECNDPTRLQQSVRPNEFKASQKYARDFRQNSLQSGTGIRDYYSRASHGRYHRGGYSSSF